MFGRFVKRQIRKGVRKTLPAPLNKFPGPIGHPTTALKKIVEATERPFDPKPPKNKF